MTTVPSYPNTIEPTADPLLEAAKKKFPPTPDELAAEKVMREAEAAYQDFQRRVGKHLVDIGEREGSQIRIRPAAELVRRGRRRAESGSLQSAREVQRAARCAPSAHPRDGRGGGKEGGRGLAARISAPTREVRSDRAWLSPG